MRVCGTPSVFAGTITDNNSDTQPHVALDVTSLDAGMGLEMTLTGNNNYSGGTSLTGGLQIGDGNTNGSIGGVVTLLDTYSLLVLDVVGQTPETFTGQITSVSAQSGSVLKIGNGTLELTGENSYTGITSVEGGTLLLGLGDPAALPANSNVTLDDGGILDINGNDIALTSVILNNGQIIDSSTGSTGRLTVTSLIGGTGGTISVNLAGDATLVESGTANGNGIYLSGTRYVQAGGIVTIASSGAFGGATTVIVQSGGTLQLLDGVIIDGVTLELYGTGDTVNGSPIGALDSYSGNNTWSGPIVLESSAQIDCDNSGGSVNNLAITQGIGNTPGGSGTISLAFGGAGDVSVGDIVGIGSYVNGGVKVLGTGVPVPGKH